MSVIKFMLLHDAFPTAECQMRWRCCKWWTGNDMTGLFKTFQHLCGETEKNHKNISKNQTSELSTTSRCAVTP